MGLFSSLKKGTQRIYNNLRKTFSAITGSSVEINTIPAESVLPRQTTEFEKLRTLKDRLQPILDEANYRWSVLDQRDLRSLAISRAMSESDDKRFFSFDNMSTEGSIMAEATRARVFLQDETSTIEGAERYTREESYKQYMGQFGSKYATWENNFRSFNTKVIDEDMAKVAFEAYRRLEESEAARILAYGSENMIVAIYDMVVTGGYRDKEKIDQVYDVIMQAEDVLDREIGIRRQQFETAFKRSNEIGNIIDVVEAENDYFGRSDW